MIESLSMLRGRDIKLSNGITIQQPTLGQIEELDEDKYMSMLSIFVSTPFDMIAQLHKMGVDFTKISSYQLFCSFYQLLELEETQILFGDLDFQKFKLVGNDNRIELHYKDIVINESVYNEIVDCLRLINSLSPPKFKGVANEYTKQKMIEDAEQELELAKRRGNKHKSALRTLVSRLSNHPYFKYRLDEVWDMKIYAFYDALKSVNIIESTNHLSVGAYSGNLDLSKINKNEFNWLREVKN